MRPGRHAGDGARKPGLTAFEADKKIRIESNSPDPGPNSAAIRFENRAQYFLAIAHFSSILRHYIHFGP
jgi:hypothetical protein